MNIALGVDASPVLFNTCVAIEYFQAWLGLRSVGFVCFLMSGIGFEVIAKMWQFHKSQLSHCSLMFSSDLGLAIYDAKRLDHEISFRDLGPPGSNDWENPSSKYARKVKPFFAFFREVTIAA